MTIFQLVRIALDQLYKDGLSYQSASDLAKAIIHNINCLSNSYSQLNDTNRKPVNYKDPAIRFAYVYKYVAAHADYILKVLEILRRSIGQIFAAESARVSCIGGGPGSDIIAVLKYLHERKDLEPAKKVTFYLLDKEQGWADSWTELDECLGAEIRLNVNFQPLDVANPPSWESQKKFLQADLFTMSYFVSEVMCLDKNGNIRDFWSKLFEHAKPQALFLYIDNGHSDFTSYFDGHWKTSGMECLISKNNVKFIPNSSEQASELVDYTAKFKKLPKIQAQVTYRILRKPGRE